MISEREHWLSITADPEWKRNHIADPNISLAETVDAICAPFPEKPQGVLEIGCGYGRLTREVGKRYPDAMMWGLDVNPAALAEAKTYDPDTIFILGDSLYNVPPVDAIYSVAVFQHLSDDEKRAYIKQAWDVLPFGGVFRFQFIEGTRDLHLEHWTPFETLANWMLDLGFTVGWTEGLAHPQWTWVTGTK